jgi:hypothetical protein
MNVYTCNVTGAVQLSIELLDEKGSGHGYRICGPKFMADSTLLRTYTLTERDADEIRKYLDLVPQAASQTRRTS